MKKWMILGICILALAGLIVGAYFLYDKYSEDYAPDALSTDNSGNEENADRPEAPDFTVQNEKGKSVSLSDFKGKPVVINFWASWCSPCKSEMPTFDEAYEKYGGDVQFMMINLTDGGSETLKTANAYLDSQDYSFPVFFDTEMSAAIAYGTTSIPVTYFVDSEGCLVAYASGAISADMLAEGIGMISE